LKSDNQIPDILTANLSTVKIIQKWDANFPSPLFKYVDIGERIFWQSLVPLLEMHFLVSSSNRLKITKKVLCHIEITAHTTALHR
jgi:hypothetical protein